ncbi:MAG TPA: energy transducer TonB, partial [Terriglobales bacterium]|nr:energy transducer TonB [Terriglobales bacterium]
AALPEASSTQAVNENRKAAAPLKGEAENTAPDTTTDLGLPPAPLVVEGGHGHAGAAQHGENPIAPPSLNAVADGSKPGLGGMVNAAPVKVPKLAAAPEAPSAPGPTRVRVSQGVTQGLLVRKVNPQYPAMARDSRLEGDVLLEAVIGTDGSVRDLRVVSGPALLVGPAMQAVRQWRYKPYLLNGQPVEVETQIKLQFRL